MAIGNALAKVQNKQRLIHVNRASLAEKVKLTYTVYKKRGEDETHFIDFYHYHDDGSESLGSGYVPGGNRDRRCFQRL
jgi:hypothetical protein